MRGRGGGEEGAEITVHSLHLVRAIWQSMSELAAGQGNFGGGSSSCTTQVDMLVDRTPPGRKHSQYTQMASAM